MHTNTTFFWWKGVVNAAMVMPGSSVIRENIGVGPCNSARHMRGDKAVTVAAERWFPAVMSYPDAGLPRASHRASEHETRLDTDEVELDHHSAWA